MKVSFLFICCVLLVVLYTCFQSDARSFRRRGGYSVRGSLRRGRFRGYSVRGSLRRGRFGGYSVRGSLRRGIKRIKTGIRNVGRKIKSGADFVAGAAKGSVSMAKAYKDLRDANWKNSDKYFHARGNSDAAKHGPGGKWAAKVISNARENIQGAMGGSKADSAADQTANRWGRNGGNPNKYRPKDLPKKYKK